MADGTIKPPSSNYVERYSIGGSTKNDILANIDSLVITSGYYFCYITATEAEILGLSSSSYYLEILANSQNYRIIRATDIGCTNVKFLYKSGGVWANNWRTIAIS